MFIISKLIGIIGNMEFKTYIQLLNQKKKQIII